MSLNQEPAPEQAPPVSTEIRQGRLRRRLWAICFVLFAFEIGSFLLIFPWMDAWTLNHLPTFFPSVLVEFQDLWDDPLFKSAVSGLGLLNVYISLSQAVSLLRRGR
jgi:hypothetical protein